MTPSYCYVEYKDSVMLVMVGNIEIGVMFWGQDSTFGCENIACESQWANEDKQWIIQNITLCSRGHGSNYIIKITVVFEIVEKKFAKGENMSEKT